MNPKKMREVIASSIIEFYVKNGGDLSDEKRIKKMTDKIASDLEKAFPAWDGGD